MDRVSNYCDPVYIIGDLNVCLDRDQLLEVYGFAVRNIKPTHVRAWRYTLDVVAT